MTDVKLKYGKPGRGGKVAVTLESADAALYTAEVKMLDPDSREAFAGAVEEKLPGLSGLEIRAKLEEKAAAMAQAGTAGRDTRPAADGEELPCQYQSSDSGMVWMKPTQNGPIPMLLTNFPAAIVADVKRDDGAEVQHAFEIGAKLDGREHRFSVPARSFASIGQWAMDNMGAGAIVYPGPSAQDHARAAIQLLSRGQTQSRVEYGHTGWRKIDGRWLYLNAAGAIGKDGAVAGVEVVLPDALSKYRLPAPPAGEELIRCVQASLRLIDLAPDHLSIPAYCCIWRAALGGEGCEFSLHWDGPTGNFKTETAALHQQHWGAELNASNLPASWSSTDNALEGQAFAAKDALLVIDDFNPRGSPHDIQKFHQKADRIIRAQGNSSGRQRMRADGTLRPAKPPRGLIGSTGETVPTGQSLRARMLIAEISPGTITPAKLTLCQQDARQGLYAGAMAGFIQHVAASYDAIRTSLRKRTESLRDAAGRGGQHFRTPTITGNLAAGLEVFLTFARSVGAITADESDRLWRRGWAALQVSAARQSSHQIANEPTSRFLELVADALSSGNAHCASADGSPPQQPNVWGWQQRTIGTGMLARDEWQPQGERVGWVEDDSLYLLPDVSYRVAQSIAGSNGEGLTISAQTLRKRLSEKGLLIRESGHADELLVRRTLEGAQRRVLQLLPGSVLSTRPESGVGGQMAGSDGGFADGSEETRHQNEPQNRIGGAENEGDGGNGGFGGFSRMEGARGLTPEQLEAAEERAAIMEMDGGMTADRAASLAVAEVAGRS